MNVCMYVCVCVIINIKFYHKTLPQFKTNYSWFTLVSIKYKKKELNCSLHTKKINNTNKLMQLNYHSALTKIQKLQKKKRAFFFLVPAGIA